MKELEFLTGSKISLHPQNFDDLFVVRRTHHDRNISLVHVEMLCDEFANRFVRGSIDRWGFDLDFVASVGLLRDAFALATRMYLDVDSHGVLREGDAVVLYRGGGLEFLLLVVFHRGE